MNDTRSPTCYWVLVLSLITGMALAETGPRYALNAHSGQIRVLSEKDTTRTITVARTQTFQVKSTSAGPVFEVSFADVDQGVGRGFDHPTVGSDRIDVVLAVFEYLSGMLPQHSGTARVHFELSELGDDVFYGAIAFPFFPGYPCETGFQKPLMYRAIVNNEHIGQLDGSIVMNFGSNINYHLDYTRPPPSTQMDLYSLVLHEAVHTLGFLGFAHDQQGLSRIFCDRQSALPNFVEAIRNEADEPLWKRVNGVPEFVADWEVESSPSVKSHVEIKGLSPELTRLHKNLITQDGEVLAVFSGHWDVTVGALMSPNQPRVGVGTRQLSMSTLGMINEVIGYSTTAATELFGLTGSWFDPATSGQGFNIQFITADRFLVYFYGFLDTSERFWLVGDFTGGVAVDTSLTVTMFEATGGVFNDFDPDNVAVEEWGTLTLEFSNCSTGVGQLSGPEGVQEFNLVKLAGVEALSCD